jgi:hypothetical protein
MNSATLNGGFSVLPMKACLLSFVITCFLWFASAASLCAQSAMTFYGKYHDSGQIYGPVPPKGYILSNTWATISGRAGCQGWADGTNSAARFSQPAGIARDSAGCLYVADAYNHTIRMITPVGTSWVVSTVAGTPGQSGSTDGTNSDARFNEPAGVAVDTASNLYVADTLNDTIRKITPAGTNCVVSTIAGYAGRSGSANGTNTHARFNQPGGGWRWMRRAIFTWRTV